MSLPIAAIILLLVFSSLVAAGMPLLVAGLSIPTTLGLVYLVARQVEMSIDVLNIATMLGLALAIDDSLFVVWHMGARVRTRGWVGGRDQLAVSAAVGYAHVEDPHDLALDGRHKCRQRGPDRDREWDTEPVRPAADTDERARRHTAAGRGDAADPLVDPINVRRARNGADRHGGHLLEGDGDHLAGFDAGGRVHDDARLADAKVHQVADSQNLTTTDLDMVEDGSRQCRQEPADGDEGSPVVTPIGDELEDILEVEDTGDRPGGGIERLEGVDRGLGFTDGQVGTVAGHGGRVPAPRIVPGGEMGPGGPAGSVRKSLQARAR